MIPNHPIRLVLCSLVMVIAASCSTPPRQAAQVPPTTHQVVSGETFSDIAQRYYGDPDQWIRVANANPLIDPTRLREGDRLIIPARD